MLTESQINLYIAIRDYIEEYGFSPTLRDLGKILGKNSTATIWAGLKILKRKGYIDYIYNRNRTIKITKELENVNNR